MGIHLYFKTIYLNLGAAWRPSIPLTAVAKAFNVWFESVEAAVQADQAKKSIIFVQEELKLSSNYTRQQ